MYCQQPNCEKPQNSMQATHCVNCGSNLLLTNRYRVLKPLGQGNFGRTYLAVEINSPSQQYCVIKQFFPQNSTENIDIFRTEAQRLQQLGHHPQIPSLLAYFEQDNYQYLVQEFVEGLNLKQHLEQKGSFDETQIRQLLKDILPLLQFIHSQQVIHRDIKPENIICRQSDGKLFLVDFGVAKLMTGTAIARTGTVVGSAAYTAPEQLVGKATLKSDLYSLGVTCIHLLTGVEPFDLYSISKGNWAWRDALCHPLTTNLGEILDKLLERAINKRYQEAAAVLLDLNSDKKPKTEKSQIKNKWILVGAIALIFLGCTSSLFLRFLLYKPSAISEPFTAIDKGVYVDTITDNHQKYYAISVDKTLNQTNLNTYHSNQIRTWFLDNKPLLRIIPAHKDKITSVVISSDGKTIAGASMDKVIKVWYLQTGTLRFELSDSSWFRLSGRHNVSLAISPNGQTLVSSSRDKNDLTIKVWDLANGKLLHKLEGHSDMINSVAISFDGETVASSSWDGTIRLWNLKTGQPIRTIINSARPSIVYSVAFSPDQKTLFNSSLNESAIKEWNLKTGQLKRTYRGGGNLVISQDGQLLGEANTGRLYHLKTGQTLRSFAKRHGFESIAISPNGRTVATNDTIRIQLWNWQTGKLVCSFSDQKQLERIESAIFSPDGIQEEFIRIWNYKTGKLSCLLYQSDWNTNKFTSIAFSPDGQSLAVGSDRGSIKIFQIPPSCFTSPQQQ